MIGRLTGKVVSQEADVGALRVVLDVGGVGYELTVPLGSLGRTGSDDSGRVMLWVHTHVREDALALFGFSDEAERAAFRVLIGVSNVGPKIAVAVLGALPAVELSSAVARRDLSALTSISGIGKKSPNASFSSSATKLPAATTATAAATTAASGASGRGEAAGGERLRNALTGMGFRPAEAERAVATLGERADGAAPLEDLLREALALLAK